MTFIFLLTRLLFGEVGDFASTTLLSAEGGRTANSVSRSLSAFPTLSESSISAQIDDPGLADAIFVQKNGFSFGPLATGFLFATGWYTGAIEGGGGGGSGIPKLRKDGGGGGGGAVKTGHHPGSAGRRLPS